MDAPPLPISALFAVVAVSMLVLVATQRTVLADVDPDAAERILDRRPPSLSSFLTGWWSVIVSGAIATAGIVLVITSISAR